MTAPVRNRGRPATAAAEDRGSYLSAYCRTSLFRVSKMGACEGNLGVFSLEDKAGSSEVLRNSYRVMASVSSISLCCCPMCLHKLYVLSVSAAYVLEFQTLQGLHAHL